MHRGEFIAFMASFTKQFMIIQYNNYMFAKILQNSQLSFLEQKDILKNIIQVNLKQNLPEVKLQLTHNYQQLKPILIKHWKYALRIGFALIPWQSAHDFIEGRREGTAFDLIIAIAKQGDVKHSGQYMVMELLKVYPDPWRCLVILSLAAQIISLRITNIEDYYWFLAGFIRISAGIIQSYLTIKNEPTKSNQDRIDKDLALVEICESSITNSYLILFNNLKVPQNIPQKQIMLSAASQIIGALYQSQRQGHLNVELLNKIQQGAALYLFKCYRIDQIRNIFIGRLKELKYTNPIKKIQIPDKYSEKTHIQTEGLCWIINRYLNQLQNITSPQQQLDYNLLLYSQILPLPYKLKESLIVTIYKLLQATPPSSQFQTNYPIGLLLFNAYNFQRNQFPKLSQKLSFNEDKLVKINRLKRLLSINIENLNVEKTQFVVNHLDEDSLALKQTLFLIKAVQFNFASPQLAKSVTTLFQKVSKCHGELGRKIVLTIIGRERQQKRNVQLCHELQKAYSK